MVSKDKSTSLSQVKDRDIRKIPRTYLDINAATVSTYSSSTQSSNIHKAAHETWKHACDYFCLKQANWLLVLLHARKCTAPEGQCSAGKDCVIAKRLWFHLMSTPKHPCRCSYPRCDFSRRLLKHYKMCIDSRCPICRPVIEHIERNRENRNDEDVDQLSVNALI